ncbi:diguanylate cyclase [Pseudarthrobacter chlorophenolicus A6]|uniref:Diguanylate cyclase n=1 Tax=Pseudarthrobacter chlorophenolicus (strain ATCC 700700 / DSM 12829 / CIP 107037 / JCM 12360 / KCTC 9906 / NCIMB 13794 / A6) TaxID=452863 RepID=B8H894_PSECP|nr:GGDEF domain-containing protein [Pseudarthrobacter chlorophenolicus]ACL38068.1 diguanylate cyclase [Pseudarthrobacter chlorophenolicus A6]SDQ55741.1 diguanylate cyclase (GGDEF) domain-containing protein [Pseudarthrobacter chlorophenolicus]
MVLDTTTLRIAFGLMALVLVVLFYFSAYRVTRSPYSGWWCVALVFFLGGSGCFLLDGTPHQIWANPVGNVLLVHGGVAVWAGARSLRTARPPMWAFTGLPLATLVASVLDNPATNTWSGGTVFLAAMSISIGLASRELWRLEPGYSRVRIPMAVSAGGLAVYYFFRWLAFVLEGQDGRIFVTVFGSAVTTLVTMVLLVVVSFSMAALSSEQQTRALRVVASRDDLTGLLNRKAFLDLAAEQLADRAITGASGALILADLDHFKSVNDTYGHAAGDVALRRFADACIATVRTTDLVGRYGGEEFVLLMPGASPERAELVASEISRRLAADARLDGVEMPTASYGISTYDAGTSQVDDLIAAADAALYTAKSLGRNRSARSDGRI